MQEETMSLMEWMEEFCDSYKKGTVCDNTYTSYQYVLKLLKKTSSMDVPLKTVRSHHIQRVLNEIAAMSHHDKKSYSKSTLIKARMLLKQAMHRAYQEHLIDSNPIVDISVPCAPTKKVLPLTEEEQARVLAACETDPLGHLLVFLIRTGLRRSELMSLKWSDYNPHEGRHGVICVRKSKTPAGVREVGLLKEAADIIKQQTRSADGFIFHNTRGTPIKDIVLRRLCDRIRLKSGVPTLTPHICRHTFVFNMCLAGRSPKAIAQIIGHANTDYVLDIYAWYDAKALREEIYYMEDREVSQNDMVVLKFSEREFKSLRVEAHRHDISVSEFLRGFLRSQCVI